MQVRAGRAATRADIADDLALVDVGARGEADGEVRHVRVKRFEIVGVADLHRAAIVEIPADMVYDAVAGREDRLAGLALEVDAVVEGRAGAAAGVSAPAEWRGDARIRPWVREGR